MSWKKCTYLTERSYRVFGEKRVSEDAIKYWEKVIGKEELEFLMKSYNLEEGQVLFSEDYTFSCKELVWLENLERMFYNNTGMDMRLSDFEGKEGRLVFDNFYLPFVKLGVFNLREKIGVLETFETSFVQVLLERLSKVSIGTLMFEMQLNKMEGNLSGVDSKEEYLDYNNRFLGNKDYVSELFETYPCLKRIVFESIFNFVNNYADLVKRFEEDHDVIRDRLCDGKEFLRAVRVDASVSDSHKRGKTVAIIKLDNQKEIVYKPRTLSTESAYQDFIFEVSKGCRYQLKKIGIVNRDEYGWEEFVKAYHCNSMEEIKRYYYRFGILIFVNYILNANDLHVENVIAMGEYPMVIDAETILDNKKQYPAQNARMVISDRIHESVLYSGLLPHYRFRRKGKAVNMSAINGREGEEYPILVPMVKDAGTSDMHYEYGHPFTKANHNLARLNREFIEPHKFMKEICDGFRGSYQYVLEHKKEMIDCIKIFKGLKVRHLIQDTQRYSMLLHTSFHPYFMQDGKDRNLLLGCLYKSYQDIQGDEKLVKMEINDMLHMDIPYFYLDTSKKALYGSDDSVVQEYFEKTSFEHLNEKIHNMTEKEMEDQVRFIKITLTDLDECEKDMAIRNFTAAGHMVQKDHNNVEKSIKKIADILFDTAVWGNDRTDVNWLGITSIGQRGNTAWNIQPLSNYLYDGIAGIAIFFRALSHVCKEDRYAPICDAIENNLFSYTDEMLGIDDQENESSGVFSGESGIIYVYQILYQLTKDEKYLEYAKKHSIIIKKIVNHDNEFDIIYGNAGAILVMLNLYEITKEREYLDLAYVTGELLMKGQIKSGKDKGGWIGAGSQKALSGFSHGAAGIIYALSKLWKETKDKRLLEAIENGLLFERSLYHSKYGNWIDRRERTEEELKKYSCFMTAWCHGAAGILLGRTKIYNILPETLRERIKEEITAAFETTVHSGFHNNDCLCHGNLGNTEILLEHSDVFHDDHTANYCKNIRNEIAEDICNERYDSGRAYLYGYQIPGFMTGLAGMGYSLLRDLDKTLPCVLSVEI